MKSWEDGLRQNTELESWLEFWDLVKIDSACCHIQFPLSTFHTNFPPTSLLSYYHSSFLTVPLTCSSTCTCTAAMSAQTTNNGASSQPPKHKHCSKAKIAEDECSRRERWCTRGWVCCQLTTGQLGGCTLLWHWPINASSTFFKPTWNQCDSEGF